MRVVALFLVLLMIVLPLGGFSREVPRDPDHMRIYELALRHFLSVRPFPPEATVRVGIGGEPAPSELIERFNGSRPKVQAWEKGTHQQFYCAMQLGLDTPAECYLSVSGYADELLHLYHFGKQSGEWQFLSDEVAHTG
jgi:hypothetical protein